MVKHTILLGSENPISEGSIIKLGEHVDLFTDANASKIFKQKPESDIVTLTPYALYMIAAHSKFSFGNYIVDLDKDQTYHVESFKEEPDPDAIKEMAVKFKENSDNYFARYSELKEKHEDWFETTTVVENIAPYIKTFVNHKDYVPKNIPAVVDAYKIANVLSKSFGDADLSRTTKRVIKPDMKEEWSKLTQKLKEETGYKTDAEIKKMVIEAGYMKTERKTRLKMNRQPGTDTSQLNPFVEEFIETLFEDSLNK